MMGGRHAKPVPTSWPADEPHRSDKTDWTHAPHRMPRRRLEADEEPRGWIGTAGAWLVVLIGALAIAYLGYELFAGEPVEMGVIQQ